MLAQLLRKHGLGARVVPHAAVSRTGIASFDVTGVAMVVIAHLEVEGSPSHLRYLVRRLRARCPGSPVVIGLWPVEAEILTDDRLRAAIGADYYTSTLHETVAACLDAARKVQVTEKLAAE